MNISVEIKDLLLVSPLIALFISSIIPLALKVVRGNKELNPITTLTYAFIGLIAAAGLVISTSQIHQTAFEGALIFDGISNWSALVVLFVTGLSLMLARESMATVSRQFAEFVFLVLNSAIGMLTLVWSNDLIVTFIGIEVMSLCLYIIIAMSFEEKLSKEAAFKYFILGSFASAIFLYGIAFIYGISGTTYINELTNVGSDLMGTNRLFFVGVVLVIIGFGFKVAIAPFHAWTPDVYQGAPTPITGFMATGVKLVIFMAFLRVMSSKVLYADSAAPLITSLEWLAVLTMLVGNIAAIRQESLKRMLAYSSVAHSGYALVGLIAASVGGETILGTSGVGFYMLGYTFMTLGAFAAVALFEKREDTNINIEDLKGLAQRSPWVSIALTIFMLSLAGIPPTVGFFGKFVIFSAAVKQGFFWLAVWGVISSVIGVYYYLRPVVFMYMRDELGATAASSRYMTSFVIGLSAVLVLVAGIAANPFYEGVLEAFASLFA